LASCGGSHPVDGQAGTPGSARSDQLRPRSVLTAVVGSPVTRSVPASQSGARADAESGSRARTSPSCPQSANGCAANGAKVRLVGSNTYGEQDPSDSRSDQQMTAPPGGTWSTGAGRSTAD